MSGYCRYCNKQVYRTNCPSFYAHLDSCKRSFEKGKIKGSKPSESQPIPQPIQNITNNYITISIIYPQTKDVKEILGFVGNVKPSTLEDVNKSLEKVYDKYEWFEKCLNSKGKDKTLALCLYKDILHQLSTNCSDDYVNDSLEQEIKDINKELNVSQLENID